MCVRCFKQWRRVIVKIENSFDLKKFDKLTQHASFALAHSLKLNMNGLRDESYLFHTQHSSHGGGGLCV